MTRDFHNSLGVINAAGRHLQLPEQARLRHLYVIGQTGTGKSTLLHHLIAEDLAAGRGVALFDPHGDLAQAVVGSIPTNRAHHLVYLCPSDLERPIGFNPLADIEPDKRALAAEGIVSAFRHVWPDSWGPRLEHILGHALRALIANPGMTLLAVPRLLSDDRFRKRILKSVTDPIDRQFWDLEFDAYDDRFRTEAIAPILNKVGKVLATPALRNIIAQPKSSIDLRRMMDDGRILIVNLSKGMLGEGPSHLLGALLISALTTTALSRADIPTDQRRPFFLYADEFQTYTTTSFAVILAEARKYGLALTLAHQYLAQLPDELQSAVLGNVGSLVALRVGAEDNHLVLQQLDLRDTEAPHYHPVGLPNFTAHARVLLADKPSYHYHMKLPPPPSPLHTRSAQLIDNSRIRFGGMREIIERNIAKFLQNDL